LIDDLFFSMRRKGAVDTLCRLYYTIEFLYVTKAIVTYGFLLKKSLFLNKYLFCVYIFK